MHDNYFWGPNFDIENEKSLLIFRGQFEQKHKNEQTRSYLTTQHGGAVDGGGGRGGGGGPQLRLQYLLQRYFCFPGRSPSNPPGGSISNLSRKINSKAFPNNAGESESFLIQTLVQFFKHVQSLIGIRLDRKCW